MSNFQPKDLEDLGFTYDGDSILANRWYNTNKSVKILTFPKLWDCESCQGDEYTSCEYCPDGYENAYVGGQYCKSLEEVRQAVRAITDEPIAHLYYCVTCDGPQAVSCLQNEHQVDYSKPLNFTFGDLEK